MIYEQLEYKSYREKKDEYMVRTLSVTCSLLDKIMNKNAWPSLLVLLSDTQLHLRKKKRKEEVFHN